MACLGISISSALPAMISFRHLPCYICSRDQRFEGINQSGCLLDLAFLAGDFAALWCYHHAWFATSLLSVEVISA